MYEFQKYTGHFFLTTDGMMMILDTLLKACFNGVSILGTIELIKSTGTDS